MGTIHAKHFSSESGVTFTIQPNADGEPQFFLIIGRSYTTYNVAYIATYRNGVLSLNNLGGSSELSADGTTITAQRSFTSGIIISELDFDVS